jgi:hypothetical protein
LIKYDMTIEQDFVFEMRRLKTLLLPEVKWGTVECLIFCELAQFS